jgi:integrase
MAVYKRGNVWWYKFNFNGESIRESTKQSNRRVAVQMEAAHKTALAKGEVGIREHKTVPTLKVFAEHDFLPHVRSRFAAKAKTQKYYEYGVKSLCGYERLANERLDAITTERISEYVNYRQKMKTQHGHDIQIATLNRELQALRRMFTLAQEWGKVERALPKVRMLPGEKHRERVLTPHEELLYFKAAASSAMTQHADPALLGDVATILLDCGLRPEECFRLRPQNVTDGKLEVHFGKSENARRRIPMTPRVKAVVEKRLKDSARNVWVFPSQTRSGHIEPSSLKKQHARAIREASQMLRDESGRRDAKLEPFELYTLRHTCLTRWAPHMDPWTLAYLAGHRDMNITKRYIHPQEHTIRDAMKRAESGHNFGHRQKASGSHKNVS